MYRALRGLSFSGRCHPHPTFPVTEAGVQIGEHASVYHRSVAGEEQTQLGPKDNITQPCDVDGAVHKRIALSVP